MHPQATGDCVKNWEAWGGRLWAAREDFARFLVRKGAWQDVGLEVETRAGFKPEGRAAFPP